MRKTKLRWLAIFLSSSANLKIALVIFSLSPSETEATINCFIQLGDNAGVVCEKLFSLMDAIATSFSFITQVALEELTALTLVSSLSTLGVFSAIVKNNK